MRIGNVLVSMNAWFAVVNKHSARKEPLRFPIGAPDPFA